MSRYPSTPLKGPSPWDEAWPHRLRVQQEGERRIQPELAQQCKSFSPFHLLRRMALTGLSCRRCMAARLPPAPPTKYGPDLVVGSHAPYDSVFSRANPCKFTFGLQGPRRAAGDHLAARDQHDARRWPTTADRGGLGPGGTSAWGCSTRAECPPWMNWPNATMWIGLTSAGSSSSPGSRRTSSRPLDGALRRRHQLAEAAEGPANWQEQRERWCRG